MAGEYRAPEVLDRLPKELAEPIRLGDRRMALTDQSIHNATIRRDLTNAYAEARERIGIAKTSGGLRDGSVVVIDLPSNLSGRAYKPGELFFTT